MPSPLLFNHALPQHASSQAALFCRFMFTAGFLGWVPGLRDWPGQAESLSQACEGQAG